MKKTVGSSVSPLTLTSINDTSVTIPQAGKLTHLQFRRFAGCPVCNIHIQSFFSRAAELDAAGINEVIVFHATKENMLKNTIKTDFDLIADPSKSLYKLFGLENSWKSLLHPSVITSAFKGIKSNGMAAPEKLETELVVPADFLIDEHAKIVALKYGKHANDQWSVDELLAYAQAAT